MKRELKRLIDYEENPVLLVAVYWYVMSEKVIKCLLIRDYEPKRIYF